MLDNNNLKAEDMLEDYELGLAAYAKEHLPIEYGRIKLKAKFLKLSVKDFENAVKSKMRKTAVEDFSAEPSVICIDGLSTNGAKEPQGFNVTDSGVKVCIVRLGRSLNSHGKLQLHRRRYGKACGNIKASAFRA